MIHRLIRGLQENTLIVATDGTFTNGISGGAVAIGVKPHLICKFGFPADGNPQDNFRGEVMAIIAAVFIINEIVKISQVDQPSVPFYVDSQPALSHISKKRRFTPASIDKPHSDIIMILYSYLRHIEYKIVPHWIRSHQDRSNRPICHDFTTFLNMEADETASIFIRDNSQPRPSLYLSSHPSLHSFITHLGRPIFDSISHRLLHIDYKPKMIERLIREGMPIEATSLFSLNNLQRCFKKLGSSATIKTVWRLWKTQSIAYRYNQYGSDSCLLCSLNVRESCIHVLQCAHRLRASQETLTNLRNAYLKLRLLPFMTQVIIINIRAFLESRPPISPPDNSDEYIPILRRAYDDQCKIGWDRFLRGFIANSWKIVDDTWRKKNGLEYRNILPQLTYLSVQYSHNTWQNRCARVHEPDHRSVHHRYLSQQALELHQRGRDNILRIHRSNRSFFTEEPTFDQYGFTDLKCWLQAASLILDQLSD